MEQPSQKRANSQRCVVDSCGASRRENDKIKLFSFPPADTIQGQIWREKCQIALHEYGNNISICSRHFEETYLGKKKLKKEAIPTLHLENTDNTVDIDEEDFVLPLASNAEEQVSCLSCEKHVQANRVNARKVKLLEKKVEKLRKALKKSKLRAPIAKRSKKSKVRVICNKIDALDLGEESKAFVKLILRARQKQYSTDVKFIALNLFFNSARTYRFIREKLNIHLPHHNTLHHWSPIKFLQPGVRNTGLGVLAERLKSLKKEDAEHMVLVFDEMAIRKNLTYNPHLDIIDGFSSNGQKRDKTVASEACVFLIKCLYSHWSAVVNYVVSSKRLEGHTLVSLVKETIGLLKEFGVIVRVIVCDQGSSNRLCFSLLGVTKEKPYFILDGIKIFCMYDFPHLIKSLRNQWLNSDITTPDGVVSFRVVSSLWNMEQTASTKTCPKLTAQHISPNSFEKMRVRLAVQVLSHTVQAAIRTVVQTIGFPSISEEMATATANFIQKVDRVFDSMNSGGLMASNLYAAAVQLNNIPYNCIKEFYEYVGQVRFVNEGKRVFFLDGFKLTLQSVLMLVEEFLNENSENFFIATKHLNQDTLENTFSTIRQFGGNNNNPTVAELNTILAKIMTAKILRSTSSANCEYEDVFSNYSIPDSFVNEQPSATVPSQNVEQSEDEPEDFPEVDDVFENSSNINLELASARYFIGFVAFKKLGKINCSKCSDCLVKQEDRASAPSEYFLHFKKYESCSTVFGSLVAPTDEFMRESRKHIEVFKRVFESEPHRLKIKGHMIEQCIIATPDWFTGECKDHRISILDYLLTVLIRKHCLWSVCKGSNKKRKLDIIDG